MKGSFKQKALVAGIATALSFVVSTQVLASESSENTIKLNIQKQSADSALMKLAKESGVQIFVPAKICEGKEILAISGDYTLEGALQKMLSGLGLAYEVVADGSIMIKVASGPSDESENKDDEDVEEVTVTGTRLRNVAPTSPVVVMTREDIDRQGLSSAEDIIRSLPQNFSSVNSATSFSGAGRGEDTPFGAEGHSFANLRGLGSTSTLVLVNGRRTASSASFDGGRVNLGNIPAAAIDRVEILLDGGSAIYGADALGGVINFILKKNYSGATTTVRYEDSANGGHQYSLNQLLGYAWDSGSAQLQVGYTERKSVSAFKAGFDSVDFTSRGGTNWLNNDLVTAFGNTGNVIQLSPDIAILGSLPAGHDGLDWTVNDLSLDNVEPYDRAKFGQGSTVNTETTDVNFSLEQEIVSGITAYVDASYSESYNEWTNGATELLIFGVPDTNPYNRVGNTVLVRYLLNEEIVNGPLDYRTGYNTYTQYGLVTGLRAELFSDWELSVEVNASRNKAKHEEDAFDTSQGAFREAIDGVDADGNPVPAFNPFGGQGIHDPDLDLTTLVTRSPSNDPTMDLMVYEASANGTLFSMPGGDAQLAVGMNYRPEELDLSNDVRKDIFGTADQPKWEQVASAAFFEASLPVVGEGNAMPGVESLLFNFAARYDRYEYTGTFGGLGSGESTAKYSQVSPKLGVLWEPVDTLKVRASWSESFRAPRLRSLFRNTSEDFSDPFVFNMVDPNSGDVVPVEIVTVANPDLKPSTATTISLGFDWSPELVDGLVISPTYTQIDWEDRIAFGTLRDPFVFNNVNEFPDIYKRNDQGVLFRAEQKDINLAKTLSEFVDLTVSYTFDSEWGSFIARLAGAVNLKQEEQVYEQSPVVDFVETDRGPDKVSYNASLGWDNNNYGANLSYRYTSSYENVFQNSSGESEYIEHWSTWDLTGFYEFDDGFRVNAGVRNLLNNKFPFINDGGRRGYDGTRVDTRGRVIYMELKKEFEL